ncbi:MAG: hypothetical protein J7K77_00380 [Dehalococcoidales bacterium]|nr:hypothetical protein [Dehalococcoidales bacterium]
MSDILDEAHSIMQCKECPWYKSCVMPMRFTAEDIRQQIEQSAPAMGAGQPLDPNMQNLMSSLATSAQNSLVEACPIFIERLRANPKLTQRIKEIMQNWGKAEDTTD